MDANFNIDFLQIYYGGDYEVSERIKIHQPTLLEIIEFGEARFWDLVTRFCGNPTLYRLPLWEIGKDWNEMDDYDLFLILFSSFDPEQTSLIFKDINFQEFRPVQTEDGEIILVYLPDPEIQIDKDVHRRIVKYLRMAFDFNPKTEKAANKTTKEAIIDEERMNLMYAEKKKANNPDSTATPLLSMVSFALNHPGFKYKKSELKEVGIFEFMDSIQRLQNTESVTALMHGMYSGFLDTSKLDLKKELNLMKDLH